MTRHRLDELLVQRGIYSSGSRARDAIGRGTVTVDGVVAAKPAQNTALKAALKFSMKRGAAIDVGHGQFDASLQSNPNVTSIEGLNARDLTAGHLKHKIDLIVCDVSFISLKLALPAALALAEAGARLLALIKPQFEAGRDAIGRGGIVSDPQEHERVCKEISEFLTAENWKVLGLTPASIEGGDGNKEFLIAAVKA